MSARFEIEHEAGRGGAGIVYRARERQTGERVALKVVHRTAGISQERFIQEAALLKTLSHPSIVRYIDHGITDAGDPYLVMEWLEGESLESVLNRGTRLSPRMGFSLIHQVLHAIGSAHHQAVIHRDLKPANIFLVGGDLTAPKVLDFGIARQLHDVRRFTRVGAVVGTPAYMAPEQARGDHDTGEAVDIFALGCVLFECLTGRTPFHGDSEIATLAKICLDNSLIVGDALPQLPGAAAEVLQRMLTKDPGQRPHDADALAREIAELIPLLPASGAGDTLVDGEFSDPNTGNPHATGERRSQTILLVGRRPSDTIDGAENLPDVGGPGFSALQGVFTTHGGTVQPLADGSMIGLFTGRGLPHDQAMQGARCAMALRPILPGQTMALSTSRSWSDEAREGQSLGELVDSAAALFRSEPVGQVRVDPATVALLESRFATSGGDTPYILFERVEADAPREVLGRDVPCVGRDREIGLLTSLYEEAVAEDVARIALITGAAGSGKSRVRSEFLGRIRGRAERPTILMGHATAISAGAPLIALANALRLMAEVDSGRSVAERIERVYAFAAATVPQPRANAIAPFLGEVMGVHFPDENDVRLRAARQDPRLMNDQRQDAWLTWVRARLERGPVVLVMEDFHWADRPTIEYVDAVLRMLPDKPFMAVAFGRLECNDRFPGLWAERNLQSLVLPPLSRKSAEKLVRAVRPDLDAALVTRIVDRGNGNAFYLEELMRSVHSEADLATLPDSIIGMVQARFDGYGIEGKRVLRIASVFGRTFPRDGLVALMPEVSRTTLDRWLEIFTGHDVLDHHESTRSFTFAHSLLHDASYAMLVPDDARTCHLAVGCWLEQATEPDPVALMDHFDKGGDSPRVAVWAEVAAKQALEGSDPKSALERVERGLAATGDTPALAQVRGRLHLVEARACSWVGDVQRCEIAARATIAVLTGVEWVSAMRELGWSLGNQRRPNDLLAVVEAIEAFEPQTPDEEDEVVLALSHAMELLLYSARADVVGRLFNRVQSAVARSPRVELARLAAQATRAELQGDMGVNLGLLLAALPIAEQAENQRRVVMTLLNLAITNQQAGMLDQALLYFDRAQELAERIGSGALARVYVPLNRGLTFSQQGDVDKALAELEHARAQAVGFGDVRAVGGAELFTALALARAARWTEVETALARINPEAIEDTMVPMLGALRALLALWQGRAEAAREMALKAHDAVSSSGFADDTTGLAYLALGLVLEGCGQGARALDVVASAAARLQEQAQRLTPPASPEAFLKNRPEHVKLLALLQSLKAKFSPATPEN